MTERSDITLMGIGSFTVIMITFIITEMYKVLGWAK